MGCVCVCAVVQNNNPFPYPFSNNHDVGKLMHTMKIKNIFIATNGLITTALALKASISICKTIACESIRGKTNRIKTNGSYKHNENGECEDKE